MRTRQWKPLPSSPWRSPAACVSGPMAAAAKCDCARLSRLLIAAGDGGGAQPAEPPSNSAPNASAAMMKATSTSSSVKPRSPRGRVNRHRRR